MLVRRVVTQGIIAVLMAASSWVVADQFWFSEWQSKLNTQQDMIAKQTKENDITDRYRQEHDQLVAEVDATRDRYRQVEKYLPSVDGLGELFEQVKDQARAAHLVIERKDDMHAPYKPGINESRLVIQLRGSFLNHLKFLEWMGNHPRLLVFSEQEVRSTDGTTTMTLKGFAPVDVQTKEVAEATNTILAKR